MLSAPVTRRGSAATGRLHADIGQSQETLKRSLADGDLLQIGKTHRQFAHRPHAGPETEASIRDHVPALFVIEAQQEIGDG